MQSTRKLHQQLARIGLRDLREVCDAVVAVVHVQMRNAYTSVQHIKVARVYRNGGSIRQFAAQEDQVVANTLDVAVDVVCGALSKRLRVRMPHWRLAVEKRECVEELVS